MSISAVQEHKNEYEFFTDSQANKTTAAGSGGKSFIDIARELAFGTSESTEDEEMVAVSEAETENASERLSSEMDKFNLIGMLMESLFLAEIEENRTTTSGQTNPDLPEEEQQAQQQAKAAKSTSPLRDSDKVAELKQVISDFSNGKANLADLPKAMAMTSGKSGGTSAADKSGGSSLAQDGNSENTPA